MTQIKSGAHLVTEHSMDTKGRFYALEVMCRERARLADKEATFCLTKAEEWARLRLPCHRRGTPRAISSEPTHATKVNG
jgi:hypothetical protein